jgi:hypothetical protein
MRCWKSGAGVKRAREQSSGRTRWIRKEGAECRFNDNTRASLADQRPIWVSAIPCFRGPGYAQSSNSLAILSSFLRRP